VERIGVHKVPHFTTEAHSKLRRVAGLDHFLPRVFAEEPSRQKVRGELTLGMSRRHVDDQPLYLSVGYLLEGFRHLGVVPATDKRRPHGAHKGHKLVPSGLPRLHFLQFVELEEQLLLLSL
jgi:hypothetical protein